MLDTPSSRVPDSKIAREATELARQAYPPFLFNHCARTFWFADRLAESGLRFDREIVYIASMLHDLGVLEPYDQGRRFDVDGAEAARDFLEGHVYPSPKIEVVWDAIALHLEAGIANYKGPEVRLVNFGAVADVAGFRIAGLDPRFVRELIEEFPRLDFPNEWLRTLFEYVMKNPDRASGTFLEGMGRVIEFFTNNPLDALE
ncbi:MAG: HD domain-containing protein [Pseudonocardiaceae bacterium]